MLWAWLIGFPIVFCAIGFSCTRHGVVLSKAECCWIAVIAAIWPLWIVGLVIICFSLLYGCYRLFDKMLDFDDD